MSRSILMDVNLDIEELTHALSNQLGQDDLFDLIAGIESKVADGDFLERLSKYFGGEMKKHLIELETTA